MILLQYFAAVGGSDEPLELSKKRPRSCLRRILVYPTYLESYKRTLLQVPESQVTACIKGGTSPKFGRLVFVIFAVNELVGQPQQPRHAPS